MMNLAEIKALVARHGDVRAQPASDWTGPFTLPDSLREYYETIGPTGNYIEGYGNPFFLPSLAALWPHQAGYRWNGLTNETLLEWPDDWLVVADQGADPFILSRSTSAILFAYHGAGAWDAKHIFSNIVEMAACLATLGVVAKDAGASLTDERTYIVPAYKQAAEVSLKRILRTKKQVAAVMTTLGWS